MPEEMVRGVGIDIVDVARIEGILQRWGSRFIQRVFTAAEERYCGQRSRPALHYAGRFAVKEACMKAIGSGLYGGVRFLDIEVIRGRGGGPTLRLYGKAETLAGQRG
ncbi:MAG: holo-ACP synthase, partial [Syntrophales bacterium]|nr:holo-ACP synthase [Syntrophales bacterium]